MTENFVASVVWKVHSAENTAEHFSRYHDYIVVYARNRPLWRPARCRNSTSTMKLLQSGQRSERDHRMSGACRARNYCSQGSTDRHSVWARDRWTACGPTGDGSRTFRGRRWQDGRICWVSRIKTYQRSNDLSRRVTRTSPANVSGRMIEVGHDRDAKQRSAERVEFAGRERLRHSEADEIDSPSRSTLAHDCDDRTTSCSTSSQDRAVPLTQSSQQNAKTVAIVAVISVNIPEPLARTLAPRRDSRPFRTSRVARIKQAMAAVAGGQTLGLRALTLGTEQLP